MNNSRVLAKNFVANESAVIDLKSSGVEDKLNSLVFQNQKGQSAEFLWQINGKEKGGYFKEVINDLGVRVAHYDGFLTVTNGGGKQFLEAEIKI
ncbi:hypothetical protein EG339_06090 [Chryseobacterium bernardetii]|uniref:Uncharacterized protein n=1 Tax=Chryseobacterium bernardetii TaxID=1241978 RepID=A0A3G6T4T3_9FLAO|nr:hypothetical protein [Chryseobacterium bernardetii]AZB24208.1 hypothetical protein EG339_06090 [Chryseobacterium bernardetii]